MSAIVVKVDDTMQRMYQARCAHCWWRGKTYYTTRQAVEAAAAHNGAWHADAQGIYQDTDSMRQDGGAS